MKIKHLLHEYKNTLQKANIASYQLDTELILAHVLGTDRLTLLLNLEQTITSEKKATADELLGKRKNAEPIAYILGYKDFWHHRFQVNKTTLIPRPETELIIEKILQFYPNHNIPLKILDLGTGTGCLIISILHEYKNAAGIGSDINNDILDLAINNSKIAKVDNRLTLKVSNWFENISGVFDIIVANPPYLAEDDEIESDVRDFEPKTSLFAEADGLANYHIIAENITQFLAPSGMFFLEVGAGQWQKVSEICQASGLKIVEVAKDLAGVSRTICGKLS